MHIAECIELYLAHDVHGTFTKQLEQTQESQLSAGGPGSGRHPEGGRTTTEDIDRVRRYWGFTRTGGGSKGRSFTNRDGEKLIVSKDGNWSHWKSGQGFKKGWGHESLDSHLGQVKEN